MALLNQGIKTGLTRGHVLMWGRMSFAPKYGVHKWICLSPDNIIDRDDFNSMTRNEIILLRNQLFWQITTNSFLSIINKVFSSIDVAFWFSKGVKIYLI